VVRLIRSKGVGVYFITQNPADVPDDILGQLGNRVQHALRAFTPRDQKALRAAAETFRPNPRFDTEEAIPELGVGEALVSTLEKKGVPTVVERTLIRPPSSRLGPATKEERQSVMAASPLKGLYEKRIDRDSAFEMLRRRGEQAAEAAEAEALPEGETSWDRYRRSGAGYRGDEEAPSWRTDGGFRNARRYSPSSYPKARATMTTRSSRSDSIGTTLAKTVIRSAGSQITRGIVRGVLGSLFKGR
jgi:DNA helicase HerA-like ATPase